MPLPRNFVQGIDEQRRDFEANRISYLRGEFRRSGWWYYYVYALAVKMPEGTWVLCVHAVFLSLWFGISAGWRDELAVLLPLFGFLFFVSSQTGINHHIRYILPVLPFAFIWTSRLAAMIGRFSGWRKKLIAALVIAALGWSVFSSLRIWPHSMSYFNDLSGGPTNGPNHLLDSNVDWGQDLIFLKEWADKNPQARPLYVAHFGAFEPSDVYPEMQRMPGTELLPGWYAVSVNYLYGYEMGGRPARQNCLWLRGKQPVARIGYSMFVFHVAQ